MPSCWCKVGTKHLQMSFESLNLVLLGTQCLVLNKINQWLRVGRYPSWLWNRTLSTSGYAPGRRMSFRQIYQHIRWNYRHIATAELQKSIMPAVHNGAWTPQKKEWSLLSASSGHGPSTGDALRGLRKTFVPDEKYLLTFSCEFRIYKVGFDDSPSVLILLQTGCLWYGKLAAANASRFPVNMSRKHFREATRPGNGITYSVTDIRLGDRTWSDQTISYQTINLTSQSSCDYGLT